MSCFIWHASLELNADAQAPSEAEAQCAELARGGKVLQFLSSLVPYTHSSGRLKVFAAGSEDMDTLTFSAPILYRHLTFSEAKKQPISEINLKEALEGLGMNMSQVRTTYLCLLRSLMPFASLSSFVSFSVVTTSNRSRVLDQSLHSSF